MVPLSISEYVSHLYSFGIAPVVWAESFIYPIVDSLCLAESFIYSIVDGVFMFITKQNSERQSSNNPSKLENFVI